MAIYNDNWNVASVYDQAGNVVQMNILIGGETGFDTEPILQEVTSGDYQSGARNILMLASAELDGAAQLAEWVASGTPVAAVALSSGQNGRNYLWQGYRKLSEKLNNPKAARSEGDGFLKMVMVSDTVEPVRLRNLAAPNGPANPLVLPVSGVKLTLSAAYQGSPSSITLTVFDFDDNELESATISVSQTERKSVTIETPPNTFKIGWGASFPVSEFALTTNGSTDYRAG